MSKEQDAEDAAFNPPTLEKSSRLKISNNNSTFNAKTLERAEAKEWFEKESELQFNTLEARKEAAAVVVGSFWSLFRNQELQENKGPNRLKIESSIVKNLLEFAIEANKDEREVEGQGSIYLITLLLKALLEQKDKINHLEHKVQLLTDSKSKIRES
jgi:hypothetical protein